MSSKPSKAHLKKIKKAWSDATVYAVLLLKEEGIKASVTKGPDNFNILQCEGSTVHAFWAVSHCLRQMHDRGDFNKAFCDDVILRVCRSFAGVEMDRVERVIKSVGQNAGLQDTLQGLKLASLEKQEKETKQ